MSFDVEAAWAEVQGTWVELQTPMDPRREEALAQEFRDEVQNEATFVAVWNTFVGILDRTKPSKYALPHIKALHAAMKEVRGPAYGPAIRAAAARAEEEARWALREAEQKQREEVRRLREAAVEPLARELCTHFPRRRGTPPHDVVEVDDLLWEHVHPDEAEAFLEAAQSYTRWVARKEDLDRNRIYLLRNFITTHWRTWGGRFNQPVERDLTPAEAQLLAIAAAQPRAQA